MKKIMKGTDYAIKRIFMMVLFFCCVTGMTFFSGNDVQAEEGDQYSVKLSGEFHYESGQEMITYVNEERALQGAAPLELDSQLTDAAMQRAAEIAYYFSHTRPDGTRCFSVLGRAAGENIAAGNSTPKDTFLQWKYSEGHWANMVQTSYTRIGIGHFRHNDQNYWVQLFARDSANYPETRMEISNASAIINIVETSDCNFIVNNGIFDDGTVLELAVADSYQFGVKAVNGGWEYAKCLFDNDSFLWKSSQPSVATVDEDGRVTGKSHGDAVITCMDSEGKYTFFTINVSIGDVTIDPANLTGRTEVTVNTWNKAGYDNVWDMLENEVTVSYRGEELTYDVDYFFTSASSNGTNITEFDIQYLGKYTGIETHYHLESAWRNNIGTQKYTGKPIEPEIYLSNGAVEGKDYTVSYQNNVDIGYAAVTVTGIGNYHGTVTRYFAIVCYHDQGTNSEVLIKAATISENGEKIIKCSVCGTQIDDVTIYAADTPSLSATKLVHNGKIQTPSVTVKDSQGNSLQENVDYTLNYASGRTEIGRYKITVTFKGDYEGSKNLYYTIVPRGTTSAKAVLYGYDDVKFSWKEVEGATGYRIYYRRASADEYKLLANTTKLYYKKANLSDGVKYYFRVVPYYTPEGSTTKYYVASQGKTASVTTLKKLATPKVTKYSSTKVKVTWTNIAGESGYQISRSTSKTKTNIISTYATTTGKGKAFTTKRNKTYYYKVRAYKTVGGKKIYGPWSAVRSYKLK